MNKEKLEKIPTCDLVRELEKREGIEVQNVPVEGTSFLTIKDNEEPVLKIVHEDEEPVEGPAIILRIID